MNKEKFGVDILHGIKKGELVVILAKEGVGKTIFREQNDDKRKRFDSLGIQAR
jgi:KaiC/GvpD/RAD55 family RecA-like ATPase